MKIGVRSQETGEGPAEVLTNQKIDSLHKTIRTLQERLDRLPTLEGIRTEIAL